MYILSLLSGCIAAPARCGHRPVATGVARSVGHDCEPCKNGKKDWDAVWDMDSGGPNELCITWGCRSPHVKVPFWGQKWAGPGHAQACPTVDILSDSAGGRTSTVQMPIGCTRYGAHWRHLANTTEPSVCGGDAALCEITLTTCY